MVYYVIGLLILSVIISFYMKKDIVYIFPMCVLSTIVVLYIFGLINQLMAGVYALYIIGAVGLILFIYTSIKYKSEFFKSIQLVQIIIFMVFVLILLWAHWGRKVSAWDELSHWGRVVKDMVYNNRFATHPDSMVSFQNYPPANAMLQYAFIKMRGGFVEAEMYHAMYIIFFSMMMPFFKNSNKENILKIFSIIVIVLVLPLGFYTIAELYVDALLAVYFAYILIIYFTNGPSRFTFFNIALAMCAATLTKPSGVLISLLAALVIYIDFLFANKQVRKDYFNTGNVITKIGYTLLPFILLIASKISWDTHLKLTNANIKFDTAKVTLDKLINVFVRFNGTEAQNKVLVNFLDAFTTPVKMEWVDYIIDIAPITFFMIFIFIGAWLFYKEKPGVKRKRIAITGISLLIVGFTYFAGLLISYLFMFTEYEALGLAAFPRYSGTYLLGVIIFLTGIILHKYNDEETDKKKMPIHIIVMLVLLIITNLKPLLDATILAPYSTKYTALSRARYDDIATIDTVVNEDEAVYLIDIGSTGASYWACSYTVYPIYIGKPISIGLEPYYSGDVWTKQLSPDEWAQNLHDNYDYVYIYNLDYDFSEVYGHLFGGEDKVKAKTLYYIDKSGKSILLSEVKR